MPNKPKKSRLLQYLLLAVLATGLAATGTLAKYTSLFSANAIMQVAAFAGGGTVDFDIELESMTPGTVRTMQFKVQNYDEEQDCEVALNYDIEVKTTGNLPLSFSLVGAKQSGDSCEKSVLAGALDSSLKAVGGKLPVAADTTNGGRKQHVYELSVSWPEGETDEDYSREIDMVTVIVTTTQEAPDTEE